MTLTDIPKDTVQPGASAVQEEAVPHNNTTLENLAAALAVAAVSVQKIPGATLPVLHRLDDLKHRLNLAHTYFTQATQESYITSYAGEWFLDNYYIIQQTLQQLEEDMPPRYYRQLPKLTSGALSGYPRIYMLAHALSQFTESRITARDVPDFIRLFQQHVILTTGELWAFPTMLRIVEIENLIIGLDRLMEQSTIALRAFVPERVYAAYELKSEPDVIVAGCVMTLRMIKVHDWQDFFEEVSHVEAVLRRDPSGTYASMDFDTRNRYRRCIERLAAYSPKSEDEIAKIVLELAQRVRSSNGTATALEPAREAHVGYYLIADGIRETKRAIAYQPPVHEAIGTWVRAHAFPVYLGSAVFLALLTVFFLVRYIIETGGVFWQVIVAFLVAFVPAMTFASQVVNWITTRLVPPHTLPKMDFSRGIAAGFDTMVVNPALLTDLNEVDSLANQLEQHYLRNTDARLYFAILADFPDANQETLPGDAALVERARARIQALNARHVKGGQKRFFVFVRKRLWNPGEEKWMGYERKRGKLAEFNRLLLEPGAQTSYMFRPGDAGVPSGIRYVITLDADTILPRDSAQRLIGTLAHPLNQARFEGDTGHLTAGYTVLQPRVEVLPSVANQTPFTRIFAGESGLDLYTTAVSDVYQDLFGEGIFVGKGIYDVAAFERSLAGRVPENALLSHDMFEGLHGRAALVTDVVLFEDYPTHYLAHLSRIHRWVRGDWQLLPWLRSRVPSADGGRLPNRFSSLGIWKITDNLLRSLLQPSLWLMILLGWFVLPGSVFAWTVFALTILLVPFFVGVIQLNPAALVRQANVPVQSSITLSLMRWMLSAVFLPYEAVTRLDAIAITLQRLRSRKHLLEWTTAANVMRMFRRGAGSTAWHRMRGSLLLTLMVAVIAFLVKPVSALASIPMMIVWFSGPSLAERISRPAEKRADETLTEAQQRQLRTLARRTWLFFEAFVGPRDNWLPPDHYQQSPIDKIGHYTSPTNMGLMLISTLAAYDMGYIGLPDLMTRLQFAFETISRLERYRGHLLNWYSTQTLNPLPPRYVSTVDNGNFLGSLVVLQQGLAELLNTPVLRPQHWQGILDTLDVLGEILDRIEKQPSAALANQTRQPVNAMREAVLTAQREPDDWIAQLNHLTEVHWKNVSDAIVALVAGVNQSDAGLFRDLRVYVERLLHSLNSMRRDIDMLLPWFSAFHAAPAFFTQAGGEIAQAWQALKQATAEIPHLREVRHFYERAGVHLYTLKKLSTADDSGAALEWCEKLEVVLNGARNTAADLLRRYQSIQRDVDAEIHAADFGFLFDEERELFHIGYNVDTEQPDGSFYDLLASEARLASFLAIAQRDVPQKHWLQLSRPVTQIQHIHTLLSWSGTAFEYLMPLLVMRDYDNTLLHQSYKAMVRHQIAYGKQHGIPWGISESGYYAFDNSQNYQYRAFGLPSLAFKRGLERDMVVAPYASILALPVAAARVAENVQALIDQDALTTYGFVEAVDYTKLRLPPGKDFALVQEYMAHHQGMIFIALTNFFRNRIMVERFHRNPRVESVELLLMEKIPPEPTFEQKDRESAEPNILVPAFAMTPWDVAVDAPNPQAHYLSNGRYAVMLTGGGGGYSQWNNRALTRWRTDVTLDGRGQWIYIHDPKTGALWSPTCQPDCSVTDGMKATFHLNRAEYQARTEDVSSRLEIFIPPDDDIEIRRLVLTNHTGSSRRLTVSSYAEMVLASQSTDARHQAFNKMFIESEYLPDLKALLFRRRLRSAHDAPLFVLHMLVMKENDGETGVQYETDRARFLGRNRTQRRPSAFDASRVQLSGTTGATLDPIMALAAEVNIPAHSTIELAYMTLAGESQRDVLALARRYREWEQIDRALNQSRYRTEREVRSLGMNSDDIVAAQKLLSAMLYPDPAFRAAPEILAANTRSQPGLWAHGISGDYPIMLLQVHDEDQLDVVLEMVQVHRFWHNRGFPSTLVLLNQRDTGYMQELYQQIHRLIVRAGSETLINRHDGIFILRAEQISESDRVLLRTAARVLLDAGNGALREQLSGVAYERVMLPPLLPGIAPHEVEDTTVPLKRPENLRFDNGVGGFSEDGREYVIYVEGEKTTPAPWINVIANAKAGFIVSEAGGGYSWSQNSGENRISDWRNDPVIDMPSEAVYLRDEETAEVWSPTPMPAGTDAPFVVRHGAGYSMIDHHSHGLRQSVLYHMAPNDPVKFVRIRLKNTATRPRRVTVTYYLEWVLGTMRDVTQQYIIPDFDPAGQTLLAHNPYSIDFGSSYGFITADRMFHSMTTDRTEFIGRMGSRSQPAGLRRLGLTNTVRAGIDPCAVVQLHVDLPVDGQEEVCFIIGAGESRAEALELSGQYRVKTAIEQARRETVENWRHLLDSIIVRTPDEGMNVLLPWLLYQALSCRILGRSGLYQSSGAFGFRDQLQDVMALVHVRPDLARAHILRAAHHQFEAGDVLHWWHPPVGRGVRTRFSDDLVWLPYVVSHYVETTGDESILQETVPFLKADPLRPDEEERYGLYEKTADSHSIYEHCRRALEFAYTLGKHNLPLMKAGDWNDGMNRVGIEGRGESVWMGWFLYTTLKNFSKIATRQGDSHDAENYQGRMSELKTALEKHAWDGEWYLRAYYDSGAPLGSRESDECQIDSLPQSWGILSGAADPARAQQGMQSVQKILIDDTLIRLFTPPFDKTLRDPGYIKGYPPGIRENGGQYTHAALWVIWAFAEMGQGDTAQSLFNLLNPIYHSDTPEEMRRYIVEPYVIAADVYSVPPYHGRGGWTWYTGSSGWMYRLGIEAILGMRREGANLRIDPRISNAWDGYEIDYRYGKTTYAIMVKNPDHVEKGVVEVRLDDAPLPDNVIPLVDDGQPHRVIVTMG